MEGEIDGGDRSAGRRARRVERVDIRHRLDRGVERPTARLRASSLFEGECGEHGVANEFEHLAAARPKGGGQNLEHVVEQVHDDGARRRVADRRKAADVGVPDDRAQSIDRTAFDRAGMHAPAGVLAEIRAQQSRGDDVAGMGFHRQRKRRQRRLHERRVVVAEAALAVGRERIDDARSLRAVAVRELEEMREIVRGADWRRTLAESGNHAVRVLPPGAGASRGCPRRCGRERGGH